MNVLHKYEMDEWLMNILQAMHKGSKAYVGVNGFQSDYFDIKHSMMQGCVMSPWLFNDVVLMVETPEQLQYLLDKMQEETEYES